MLKYGVNQGLRKVDLKLTLTNEIISRKIVISRVETLYIQNFREITEYNQFFDEIFRRRRINNCETIFQNSYKLCLYFLFLNDQGRLLTKQNYQSKHYFHHA